MQEAWDAFGGPDALVNNAGMIRRSAALNSPKPMGRGARREPQERVFSQRAPVAADRPGKIIHIASLLSFQGGSGSPRTRRARAGRRAHAPDGERVGGINVNDRARYFATNNTEALRQIPTAAATSSLHPGWPLGLAVRRAPRFPRRRPPTMRTARSPSTAAGCALTDRSCGRICARRGVPGAARTRRRAARRAGGACAAHPDRRRLHRQHLRPEAPRTGWGQALQRFVDPRRVLDRAQSVAAAVPSSRKAVR